MNAKFKMTVSPLVLSVALVGCSTTGQNTMFQPVGQSASEARADQGAARYYELAQIALQKGNISQGLNYAEQAVEKSPRDAGYRMLLGDLYLKSGRFASAETTFTDVLTLFPDNNRARFNLALAQVATGRKYQAVAELDRLAQTAAPADIGLAYALAGQPERAVAMLEPAARETGADGRVRQNLALAYALQGDWQRARITAAQDLSPADLGARMAQWASFVQPRTGQDQVASLLGVTPAEDAGQPVRLALAPIEQPTVMVAQTNDSAAAVVAQAVSAPAQMPAAPVAVAVAAPIVPAPAAAPAEVSAPEAEVYASAAQSLVAPQAFASASSPAATPARTFTPIAPKPRKMASVRPAATGGYVVQVGAYNSARLAEYSWSNVQQRYGLWDHTPVTARVVLAKGIFYRLSAGFMSQPDAATACQSIKRKGGECFVRAVSGDVPVRFASRANRRG